VIFTPSTSFPAPVTAVAGFIRDILDVIELPAGVSCHGLCHGLYPVLHTIGRPVMLWDGYFGPYSATHSWFTLYGYPWYIVDPYPWACQQYPLVVCAEILSPWFHIYRQGDAYLEQHVGSDTIYEEARAVEAAIRKHLKLD
jgi:hypothetical protein